MTAHGIFITGTDTGVGKTLVSAAVLSVLRARGVDAVPMKPVQTGATRRNRCWRSPDLDFTLAAVGLQPGAREYSRMAPCCFARACSPHLAAALANDGISLRRIQSCLSSLQACHALVVVEGAGGVLAPIRGSRTMLDLMAALALPVVLVARLGLGTINHTLLALQSLRQAPVRVLGVVFNATQPGRSDYIARDNIETIARLGKVRILGRLPYVAGLSTHCAARVKRAATAGLPPAANWMKWLQLP